MTDTDRLVFLVAKNDWTTYMAMHIYNPILKNWIVKKLPEIWHDRRNFGVVLINKTMIIAGGDIEQSSTTNEVICFNLQTMKYYENPPMKLSRLGCELVELKDELYAIGGIVNGYWSCSVEKYNFSLGKWQDVAPLMLRLKNIASAVLNGLLYTTGDNSSLQCYDPDSNKWSQKAAPIVNLEGVFLIAFRESLCAVGNYGTVEFYDPFTNTWEAKQPLNNPRFYVQCAVINNRLLACGGTDLNGQASLEVEEYIPETNEWVALKELSTNKNIYSVFTSNNIS